MGFSDSLIFELSPIPMWLEDFSAVKQQFNLWKSQGISDLKAYLEEDPSRIIQCAHQIKILKVNQKTLSLFEADSLFHLSQNLDTIFQQEMFQAHADELIALWNGETEFFSTTVNYTISGKAIDIKLRAVVLPGSEETLEQVLLSTENISDYMNICRKEAANRKLAESRFTYSPTSLWVEDFSRVKNRLDAARNMGIEDFATFLDVHANFVQQCIDDIILLDVNQATLNLFCAQDKETLFKNIKKIFSKEMHQTFKEQLIDLWNGKIHHQREAINYALDGSIRYVLLQFTVFPGHENDWSVVQLALTDITARKKAEKYLEYLGKHDILTGLYNRLFFTEELHRLQHSLIRPVSAIYIDMNRLKEINDNHGHETGDEILRRMGNLLNRAIANTDFSASRIGGDEFVILMQGVEENSVNSIILSIQELLNIDNQFYSSHQINLSIGYATTLDGESVEDMIKRADQNMYQHKRKYYEYIGADDISQIVTNKHIF